MVYPACRVHHWQFARAIGLGRVVADYGGIRKFVVRVDHQIKIAASA